MRHTQPLIDVIRATPPRRCRLATVLLAALSAACGSDMASPGNHGPYPYTNVPAPANGVAQFTVLPVSIAPGQTLTALGNLSPPGHVLPTDHVYFYDWDLARGGGQGSGAEVRSVYMPATGAVFLVLPQSNGESKVMFRATSDFYFYLDHIVVSAPLAIGTIVQAGTQIGTTLPGSTVDLGAFDTSVPHSGFLSKDRYPVQTQSYVSPWKYFTPELQAQIYSHVYRAPTAPDKDGKIDFGVAGTLAGDWFLQGMAADSSSGPYGWTRSVSFAYDYYDPSLPRISIGGTITSPGVWGVDSTAPRPEAVSVSSGIVTYRLYFTHDAMAQSGLMLVQMTDSATIKVEVFPGSTASTGQFDAKAFTFVR